MSKLGTYLRRNEHPFELRAKNGKGIIKILFTDGYVTIKSIQPGSQPWVQEIHITRSAWYKLLLGGLIRVSKLMAGPDFDRYKAERIYARREQAHLQALREEKRQRRRPRRR